MGLLLWIVFGGSVGWVSSLVLDKGDESADAFFAVLYGIVGAVVGGFIMSLINKTSLLLFNFQSFAAAFAGAAFVVLVEKAYRQRHIPPDDTPVS